MKLIPFKLGRKPPPGAEAFSPDPQKKYTHQTKATISKPKPIILIKTHQQLLRKAKYMLLHKKYVLKHSDEILAIQKPFLRF